MALQRIKKHQNMQDSTKTMGDAIRVFLRQYRLEDKLTELDLEKTCRKVLGPDIEKWVEKMIFHQGDLVLEVSGAAMRQELSYHRTRIKEEVNKMAGKVIVHQVIVR
jgi:lipoate-protein ligase A